MTGGVYAGKTLEGPTSSRKLSALIGLVPEPSHDLRGGIRGRTGTNRAGQTYTSFVTNSSFTHQDR